METSGECTGHTTHDSVRDTSQIIKPETTAQEPTNASLIPDNETQLETTGEECTNAPIKPDSENILETTTQDYSNAPPIKQDENQSEPTTLEPTNALLKQNETQPELTAQEPTAQEPTNAQEAPRTHTENIRTHRVLLSRTILQPSVQDFSGKIINRSFYDTDEEQVVWAIGLGNKTQLKLHVTKDEHTYPLPTNFRWGNSITPLHLESARLPIVPNAIKAERLAAWTEDVHRRHVAQTARARERLTPKPMAVERMGPSIQNGFMDPLAKSFSLSAAPDKDATADTCTSRQSRPSSKKNGLVNLRARPATTGRYFDRGNGLRISTATLAAVRARPNTAKHWTCASPGLNITKVVLQPKDILQ